MLASVWLVRGSPVGGHAPTGIVLGSIRFMLVSASWMLVSVRIVLASTGFMLGSKGIMLVSTYTLLGSSSWMLGSLCSSYISIFVLYKLRHREKFPARRLTILKKVKMNAAADNAHLDRKSTRLN